MVYRSLDAHHFMNLELEKKVEEYKERLEDLEDRYRYNNPPTSCRDGRPYPWKMAEWKEEYVKEEAAAKEGLVERQAWGSST